MRHHSDRSRRTTALLKFINTGKPIPPAKISTLATIYTHWFDLSNTGLERPPSIFEKPALQNADNEWKAAKTISSSMVVPISPWMHKKNPTAPNASMNRVNPRI